MIVNFSMRLKVEFPHRRWTLKIQKGNGCIAHAKFSPKTVRKFSSAFFSSISARLLAMSENVFWQSIRSWPCWISRRCCSSARWRSESLRRSKASFHRISRCSWSWQGACVRPCTGHWWYSLEARAPCQCCRLTQPPYLARAPFVVVGTCERRWYRRCLHPI